LINLGVAVPPESTNRLVTSKKRAQFVALIRADFTAHKVNINERESYGTKT